MIIVKIQKIENRKNTVTPIEVFGIEKIFTDICEAQIENFNQIFKKVPLVEIDETWKNPGKLNVL